MKHQQVSVDFTNMVFTACSYLVLAGAVWIFLKLIQACFWLPRHLKKQNDVQRLLQDKVESYEKYILECEEKEKAMMTEQMQEETDSEKHAEQMEKWKERRECLEMLRRELSKVRDNGDGYDWDYLLEEDEEGIGEDLNAIDTDDGKKPNETSGDKAMLEAELHEYERKKRK